MAKATVDFTIPCPECEDISTVETQKWTKGPDHEREVYIKCLRCHTESLIGVFRRYGNTLVQVEDTPITPAEENQERSDINPIFRGRWIGITFIEGMQGKPGYKKTPIGDRIFCIASADKLKLADGQELIVDKVTEGSFLAMPNTQNLIQFTNGQYFLIIKLEADRIGVCLEFDEDVNPTKRFEGRIAH